MGKRKVSTDGHKTINNDEGTLRNTKLVKVVENSNEPRSTDESPVESPVYNFVDSTPDLSLSKDAEKLIAIYRHPFKNSNPSKVKMSQRLMKQKPFVLPISPNTLKPK